MICSLKVWQNAPIKSSGLGNIWGDMSIPFMALVRFKFISYSLSYFTFYLSFLLLSNSLSWKPKFHNSAKYHTNFSCCLQLPVEDYLQKISFSCFALLNVFFI